MSPRSFILYATDVARSVAFYSQALGAESIEQLPGFAMFDLGDGRYLGLWARHDVQPAAQAQPGAMELGFIVATKPELDTLAARWQAAGWPLLQAPVEVDFGYTACTADPDGHRLRAMVLR